jgi:hypothetical protein
MNTKIPKSKDKSVFEVDYGKYTENVSVDKSNADEFVKMIMSDHDIQSVYLLSGDTHHLYSFIPAKSTSRVEQLFKYEKELAKLEERLDDYDERRFHDSIRNKIHSNIEKQERLISKMNPHEISELFNRAELDYLSADTGLYDLIRIVHAYGVDEKAQGGHVLGSAKYFKEGLSFLNW